MAPGGAAPLVASSEAPPLFALLAVMLASVVLVSLLLLRVQRSLLIGYFLCGVAIANSGIIDHLGSDGSHDAVSQMAEFGIMLLMFVLGLEFSLGELRFLRRFTFAGGPIQMGACGAAVLAVAVVSGMGWPAAIVLGVALAMSSTAVSLKTLQDMGMSATPGGRFALGVAIFQDLFIIAFLVVFPLLIETDRGEEHGLAESLVLLLARGAGFVAVAAASARWITPFLLHAAARTRHRELFTLTVVGSCVGLAWVATLFGLGLALGAFVAGLAVSESIFKHRILSEIMPIKDLFLTLFFVSIGLLIDLGALSRIWPLVLALTAALMLFKAVVVTVIAGLLGQANRMALLGGLALCGAGEFSLLILQKATTAALWEPEVGQLLITSCTLSMALLPAAMRLAEPAGRWLDERGWGRTHPKLPEGTELRNQLAHLSGHAIICGFGPIGRALNERLLDVGMPTLVVELNVDTVRELLRLRQPVLFADAADPETWDLARLGGASLVAFTFPDPTSTAAGIRRVRDRDSEVPIVARARYGADEARLLRLGANATVRDEAEAAQAMVADALSLLGNPVAPAGSTPGSAPKP